MTGGAASCETRAVTWIREITVRGVRQIDRWDVALPDTIGPAHAVLTGPCGSGKTSLLGELTREVQAAIDGAAHPSRGVEARGGTAQDRKMAFFGRPLAIGWSREGEVESGFVAGRWIAAAVESGGAPGRAPADGATGPYPPGVSLAGRLTARLVQRAAEQRLAEQRGDAVDAARAGRWIDDVRAVLRAILGDEGLGLVIGRDDLAMDFSDGRRLPLATLSRGHAGAVGLWAELALRVDDARQRTQDSKLDPKGVLLVDAVEAFLDPRLQRTLLPLLAHRFPGVQLVASTSSPIVAASLPGATVLDLGARRTREAPSIPPPAPLPPREGPAPRAPAASTQRPRRVTARGPGWDED